MVGGTVVVVGGPRIADVAARVGASPALVVYYFNQKDGARHVAGTFLKIPPAGLW